MTRFLLTFILALSAGTAWAEPPKAVITGRGGGPVPTKLIPGQLHRLESLTSVGDKFSWRVRIKFAPSSPSQELSNEQKAAELRADGYEVTKRVADTGDEFDLYGERRILSLPSLPGTYNVILVAAGDGDPSIDEYSLTIEGGAPGPGPGPAPIPPTPGPTPTPVGLSAAVAAEVAKAVTVNNQADWLRLADGLDQVAGIPLPTVELFVGTSKIFEDAALAPSASATAAWATIRTATIAPRLTALTTVPEYAKSWKEIAAGVRTGAGAQPPPGPTPPAPIPATGLRVLIIEETNDRATLPPAQAQIFSSTKVLGWLRTNAPDHWRVWDDDVDPASAPVEFRDALKIPRGGLPWIVISNGATGFSGPLPATADETVTLLEKYKP